MATTINNDTKNKSISLGLIIIFGEIHSNEQRNEVLDLLKKALKRVDKKKFGDLEQILNNLIDKNQFRADSQYRQISKNENDSIVGFLYLPNFHTVLNVLKEYFTSCSHVTIIFLGQQIDSNGGWLLSDSTLTSDHLHNLFLENSFPTIEDLHLMVPYISAQWSKLFNNFFVKHFKNAQINDLSANFEEENMFGENFYQSLVEIVGEETVNFDVYKKLIPRDSAGAIAFDEANLYILYGQQGEASLFGIRGFVVLINGGFSRNPSYWNLIRGLQNVDACILTHFDFDVLPGLQTVLHRKTIPISEDGRSCKPDIGAIFINQTQKTRFQSSPSSKRTITNKLTVNLHQTIEQFTNDIKRLNIETFDLIKTITAGKPSIEPINLYKKIAFGSLDLYVLHPTSLPTEDEKLLSAIQKIPIRDRQPTSSIIPLHHWYSSCLLLVWIPTSKSSKESSVRVLFTGACPQTLVFEALNRTRHLELLHDSSQQQSNSRSNLTNQPNKSKPSSSTGISNEKTSNNKAPIRSATNKPKSAPVLKKNSKDSAPISSIKRPETVQFAAAEQQETFIESNQTTPIEDFNSRLLSADPMTTSFVDGAPNTRNPFLEKSSDDENNHLDVIHHSVSNHQCPPMTTIDEIQPQNLPMNDKNSNQKSFPSTHRSSVPSVVTRKNKSNSLPGSIFYVDVAYIPYHGNENYVDSEFFRRIRARYYILNAVEISRLTLESLIDGKQQWEKQEQSPVTLVPTFDGDQLRQFFVLNKTRLADLNINIFPASTRCNVQYDDEGSSPAQRLRFPLLRPNDQ